MHRCDLPSEIDGILDTGVHAEPPGRGEQMHRVSCKQDPSITIPVGNQRIARGPLPDGDHLDIDLGAERILDITDNFRLVRLTRVRVFCQNDELSLRIQSDDTGPGIVINRPVLPGRLHIHHVVNTRRVDIDRQHFADKERDFVTAFSAIGNIERAAGISLSTIASGQPLAHNRLGITSFRMPDR